MDVFGKNYSRPVVKASGELGAFIEPPAWVDEIECIVAGFPW
jgi:hypothetical protein